MRTSWNGAGNATVFSVVSSSQKHVWKAAIFTMAVHYVHEKKKKKKTEAGDGEKLLSVPEGWKEAPFKEEDNPHGVLEESSFEVKYPTHREKYLSTCWPLVQATLSKHKIKADLDLLAGTMKVRTTRKTWDPYSIIKARDIISCLARSVPYEKAVTLMEDNVFCDIIKIKNLVRSRKKFVKRRDRLIGPNKTTLKALEILTECYVLVQGFTVTAIGPHRGLREVRRVVTDSMSKNILPVALLSTLMVKKRLMADPEMRDKDWSRMLPQHIKPKNVPRKKPLKVHKKKEYTPFPPAPPESKMDKAMASGEYFLKESEKKARERAKFMEKQVEAKKKQQERRAKAYIPPPEPKPVRKRTLDLDDEKPAKPEKKSKKKKT